MITRRPVATSLWLWPGTACSSSPDRVAPRSPMTYTGSVSWRRGEVLSFISLIGNEWFGVFFIANRYTYQFTLISSAGFFAGKFILLLCSATCILGPWSQIVDLQQFPNGHVHVIEKGELIWIIWWILQTENFISQLKSWVRIIEEVKHSTHQIFLALCHFIYIGFKLPLAAGLARWSSGNTTAIANAKVVGSNPTQVIFL